MKVPTITTRGQNSVYSRLNKITLLIAYYFNFFCKKNNILCSVWWLIFPQFLWLNWVSFVKFSFYIPCYEYSSPFISQMPMFPIPMIELSLEEKSRHTALVLVPPPTQWSCHAFVSPTSDKYHIYWTFYYRILKN